MDTNSEHVGSLPDRREVAQYAATRSELDVLGLAALAITVGGF